MDKFRREALLKECGEVCSNFRTLTDIRFKLLGLLPIAALAAAAFSANALAIERLPLSIFGLAATIGIVTYNKRNDQLYNNLVARAAAIERSIGLYDGAFANRPNSWLRFANWTIDHRTGISTIYVATIALWIFMALDAIIRLEWSEYPGQSLHEAITPPLSGFGMLSLAPPVLAYAAWYSLKRREGSLRRRIECKVCKAMDKLLSHKCSVLRDPKPTARSIDTTPQQVLADLKGDEFTRLCADICGGSGFLDSGIS
jgi:hypothetical protein